MTRDDIIKMAREAGGADITSHGWTSWVGTQSTEFLERFAALVTAEKEKQIIAANAPEIERINAYIKELEKAVAAEREACAELVMQGTNEPVQTKTLEILRKERERIADAIRARGDR